MYRATKARLEQLRPENEAVAEQALVLATLLDAAVATPQAGSSAAALAREHRAALAACEVGAQKTSYIDELKARREKRQRAS